MAAAAGYGRVGDPPLGALLVDLRAFFGRARTVSKLPSPLPTVHDMNPALPIIRNIPLNGMIGF